MAEHNLYNCYSTPTGHRIVKFDADLNVVAVYNLAVTPKGNATACDCPAGPRPSCKHRKMLPIFTAAKAVNTDRFYCYETQMWYRPVATADEPPMQEKLDLFNEALSTTGRAVEPELTANVGFETTTAVQPQPCKPREAAQQIVAEQMKPIRRI